MAKKDTTPAPAYVERTITPEEMKRRSMIENQTNKFNGMHNATRFLLVINILLALSSVMLWTVLSDTLNSSVGNLVFLIAFYGTLVAGILALLLAFNAFLIAKGINQTKVGSKTLGLGFLAVLIGVVLMGYITEVFTAPFPSF